MYKDNIINKLRSIKRDGIEDLIQYLKSSDYFNAPASTKYHGNYEGALAEHSWKVSELFKSKNKQFNLGLSEDTVYICGICHDLCKINFYRKGFKNIKDGKKLNYKGIEVDNWVEKEIWEIDDTLPLGHGDKSVIILQRFIPLSEFEVLCIKWHMGIPQDYTSSITYHKALEKYPAIIALHTADYESSYLLEQVKK